MKGGPNMALTDAKPILVKTASPFPPELHGKRENQGFMDNIEHLEALEYISRLRLARAYFLGGNTPADWSRPDRHIARFQRRRDKIGQPDLSFIDISEGEISPGNITILLTNLEARLHLRVRKSLEQGIDLHFEEFCRSYDLNEFERTVLSLLIANNTGKTFRDFYEKSLLDPHDRQDGGMSIGAILSIIHSDYRKQITSRRYFSVGSSLLKHEILIPWTDYDNTTNILDVYVYLHERIVRYLIGDNNIYDVALQCISRERSTINLDHVILPGRIKEKVFKLARDYSNNRSKRARALVEEFYGYGTGLIFLFHGPSGTGKTMLGHALATSLNKELLSVNIDRASNMRTSSEDLIKHLFKEAKLCDGVVFFDECDEMFGANSSDIRTLLIEIEKTDCITILATNRVLELDPDLDRRITMKVPFFLPEETQRERIWQALVPPNVSLTRDVDFKSLARNYIFSGGLIKNAMFTAVTKAMAKNGKSKVLLNSLDIEEAAEWQAASMFDHDTFGRTYLPHISIKDLPLRPQDKLKFERLADVFTNLNGQIDGLRLLMGISDIQTGISIVEAVAKECDLKVREFHLSDLLVGTDNSGKVIDPMTRQEVSHLEYALKTVIGHRSLTLLVDHESCFEGLLLKERVEVGGRDKDLLGFYRALKGYNGLLFLVTTPVKALSLPVGFNHYFEVHPPPEELQLREWEGYLGNSKHMQSRLINLVEKHPLHLNEISRIIREAKTTALLNGNERLTFDDICEVLRRFKSMKAVPVLFGKVDSVSTHE